MHGESKNWVNIKMQCHLISSYIFIVYFPLQNLLFGGNKGETSSAEVPKKITHMLTCDKLHEVDNYSLNVLKNLKS